MATAVLSVALHLAGFESFSRSWLAISCAIWVVLFGVVTTRLAAARARWVREADTPASLTGVAATTVIGTRLALFGWDVVPVAALVVALIASVVLIHAVIEHWRSPAVGVHFLLCVAMEGLAVLGATLAVTLDAEWLGAAALVPFVTGLFFYVLVLRRFSLIELEVGAGDHWIWTGGLAISALAAGRLTSASAGAPWGAPIHGVLCQATLVILGLALAGYAVLVGCEVRWPRLRFDVRRWATAFPLGMTAAATIEAATATGVGFLRPIGIALIWPTVVVCSVLLVASARHVVSAGQPLRSSAESVPLKRARCPSK